MQEKIMKVLQDLDSQRISVDTAYNEIQKQFVLQASRLKGLDLAIIHKAGVRIMDCSVQFSKPNEVIDLDFSDNGFR